MTKIEACEKFALEAQKREIERAFSILESYGVSRERAGSVSNGIDVLVTRMRKEIMSKEYEISDLKKRW